MVVFFFLFFFYFLYVLSLRALKSLSSSRTSTRKYNPMQIWNSTALWLLLCVTLNNIKPIPCFHFLPWNLSSWWVNFSFLSYFIKFSPFPCSPVIRECSWNKTQIEKKKRKLMIQIQRTSKLLTYEIERYPNKRKEKVEPQ